MDARHVVVIALLALAGVVVAVAALGLLAAPDLLPRLHFVTPVTSVAAPLTGTAYVVQEGMGLTAGLVILIVVLLAVTGPPLSAAMAHLAADSDGILPHEKPQ